MLWGPGGGYWEAVHPQAFHMESFSIPTTARSPALCLILKQIAAEICTVCCQTAEPAVRLRDPAETPPFFHFRPVCLPCVTDNPGWLESSGSSIPRMPEQGNSASEPTREALESMPQRPPAVPVNHSRANFPIDKLVHNICNRGEIGQ